MVIRSPMSKVRHSILILRARESCRTRSERGAVLIFAAFWLVSFLMLVAFFLSLWIMLMAVSVQRNTADYVALGVAKAFLQPAPGTGWIDNPPVPPETEGEWRVRVFNVAIAAAGIPVEIPLPGTNGTPQYAVSDLELVWNTTDAGNCSIPGAVESDDDAEAWCGFDPSQPTKTEVVFGMVDGSLNFYPIPDTDPITNINAVKVKLHFSNSGGVPLILPMVQLLGSISGLSFSSEAVAVVTGAGIRLITVNSAPL